MIAAASDDVGVVSVQFLLDGAPLGEADVAAPYEVAWPTTTAANGAHTLTALARDAVGHETTSAARRRRRDERYGRADGVAHESGRRARRLAGP